MGSNFNDCFLYTERRGRHLDTKNYKQVRKGGQVRMEAETESSLVMPRAASSQQKPLDAWNRFSLESQRV